MIHQAAGEPQPGCVMVISLSCALSGLALLGCARLKTVIAVSDSFQPVNPSKCCFRSPSLASALPTSLEHLKLLGVKRRAPGCFYVARCCISIGQDQELNADSVKLRTSIEANERQGRKYVISKRMSRMAKMNQSNCSIKAKIVHQLIH